MDEATDHATHAARALVRAYRAPCLRVYGTLNQLTAAGTGPEREFEKASMLVGGEKRP